jgi:hypothetical protein
MEIRPVGEAIYEVNGQIHSILAAALKHHSPVLHCSARYKSDTDEWYTNYSAYTQHGTFTWQVHSSLGCAGLSLNDFVLVAKPGTANMIHDVAFEEIEDEDNDDGYWGAEVAGWS